MNKVLLLLLKKEKKNYYYYYYYCHYYYSAFGVLRPQFYSWSSFFLFPTDRPGSFNSISFSAPPLLLDWETRDKRPWQGLVSCPVLFCPFSLLLSYQFSWFYRSRTSCFRFFFFGLVLFRSPRALYFLVSQRLASPQALSVSRS